MGNNLFTILKIVSTGGYPRSCNTSLYFPAKHVVPALSDQSLVTLGGHFCTEHGYAAVLKFLSGNFQLV